MDHQAGADDRGAWCSGTTVRYGDVWAKSQPARVLVIIEILFNGVFLAAAASLLTNRVRAAAQARVRRRAAPGENGSD
jgi:voltage-gated potassium channel